MNAGDSPVEMRRIMALAYANLWDERLGQLAGDRPFPLRL
jgi:hypothetical protein